MAVSWKRRFGAVDPSLWTLLLLVTGTLAVVGAVAAATVPLKVLVGEEPNQIVSAFHGIAATVFLLSSSVTLYLGLRLFAGRDEAQGDLKLLSALNVGLSMFTIAFGNWVYIAYRGTGGPRSYFLEQPGLEAVHEIFFEFKEFIAIFTLPMFALAAFLIWRYGRQIQFNRELRGAVTVALTLGWIYLMIAFTLGAAITKIRGV